MTQKTGLTVMIDLTLCISKHKKLKFTITYVSEHVIFLETDLKNNICVMFCLYQHIKE
jgi:hypothetical protein